MLRHLTAVAAVLAILFAAKFGVGPIQSDNALGALFQMSERLNEATSVYFVTTEKNVLVGMEAVHKTYTCDTPRRSRSEIAIGGRSMVQISDDTGAYIFEPVNKQVIKMMAGPGAMDPAHIILTSVENAVSKESAESLGTRDVEGETCQVYRVPLADGDIGEPDQDARTTLEISISEETFLPTRIVYLEPSPDADGEGEAELHEAVIMSDFRWNEVFDASLFDTSVPDGWQLVDRSASKKRSGN